MSIPPKVIRIIPKLEPIHFAWKGDDTNNNTKVIKDIMIAEGLNPENYYAIECVEDCTVDIPEYTELIIPILSYIQSLEKRIEALETAG